MVNKAAVPRLLCLGCSARLQGCFAKAILALSPVMFATYVAATRLVDYKHDFSDVNAGW